MGILMRALQVAVSNDRIYWPILLLTTVHASIGAWLSLDAVKAGQVDPLGQPWLLTAIGIWMGFAALGSFLPVEKEKMSAEELAKREREAHRAKQYKLFQKDAKKEIGRLQDAIGESLAKQHRIEHQRARDLGVLGKRQLIKLELPDALVNQQTEVWFPINGKYLPYGTRFTELVTPEVQQNLAHGIRRDCRFEVDEKYHDIYLVVSFRGSLAGLPYLVYWRDVYDKLTTQSKYSAIIGINRKGEPVTQNLIAWPHGLVLGGTGNGKTTWFKQAFITLIQRCSPDELTFTLMDLKGTEWYHLQQAPHVTSYLDTPEEAMVALETARAEMYERFALFKGICSDITEYNDIHKDNRLNRHFIWIDELSLLTRSGDAKSNRKAIWLILQLAARGRQAGYHILLGTQTVNKYVLTHDILANIEGRICYGLRNKSSSILAIDTGDAVGLSPPGRCAIIAGVKTVFLQTPYVEASDISAALENAKLGQSRAISSQSCVKTNGHKWQSIEDAIAWSWPRFGSRFVIDEIWAEARGRVALKKLRAWAKAAEGQTFNVNGEWLRLKPPQNNLSKVGGIIGRRLVPIPQGSPHGNTASSANGRQAAPGNLPVTEAQGSPHGNEAISTMEGDNDAPR